MMTATILDAAAGRVAYSPSRSRVAIIGASGTRAAAPFFDPTWVVWGLNEITQPRADAWFEMHPMSVQSHRELAWLSVQTAPVYVLDLVPEVPRGVRYPLERVLAETGGRKYFTCTFAYQIALAIAEGFTEIGLWGVDLDYGTTRERLAEKPCVEYWIGVAEGKGIHVTLPERASLCTRPYLYGYSYHEELRDIQNACTDLVSSLPQNEWPAGTIDRLRDAIIARMPVVGCLVCGLDFTERPDLRHDPETCVVVR